MRLDDCKWMHTPSRRDPPIIAELRQKHKIKELLWLSTVFKVPLPLVRVDFYWHEEAFHMAELTLSTGAFNACISASCAEQCLQGWPKAQELWRANRNNTDIWKGLSRYIPETGPGDQFDLGHT